MFWIEQTFYGSRNINPNVHFLDTFVIQLVKAERSFFNQSQNMRKSRADRKLLISFQSFTQRSKGSTASENVSILLIYWRASFHIQIVDIQISPQQGHKRFMIC